MDLRPILQAVLEGYSLPWDGDHGIAHWARVLENGLHLAQSTGADTKVVSLFSILHDSRRLNEDHDPDHGLRGGDFAVAIRGKLFDLPDRGFQVLYRACEGHTRERTHPDVTIQTCWDADRLDLGRVGITPHPSRLSTELAKTQAMMDWATERAIRGIIPPFVLNEWGVDLDRYTKDRFAEHSGSQHV
jgi:uncharacterized protein